MVGDNLESFCVDWDKTFFGVPRTLNALCQLVIRCRLLLKLTLSLQNTFTASIDYSEFVRSVSRQCLKSFMFEKQRIPWLDQSNNVYCHTIQCVHTSLALGAENAYSVVWPVRKFPKTKKYSTYRSCGPVLHPVVAGQLANYGTSAR